MSAQFPPIFLTDMISLPEPDAAASAASQALIARISDEIKNNQGWIGFDRFMAQALYTPGLGYYSGGSQKFGQTGDFVTAPEISPFFAQAIAGQVIEVFALSAPAMIEVGAGSGQFALDLLFELERSGALPDYYGILDLSGQLRARQQILFEEKAPSFLERIHWLDRLPETFRGLVFGNEVLDAMPAHLVHWQGGDESGDRGDSDDINDIDDNALTIFERGVAYESGAFVWQDRPATGRLLDRAQHLADEFSFEAGFVSEINLNATDWVQTWAGILQQGALLLIDYGFPQHEFYHPQRNQGTLMCHYRHHAHGDPFFLPGLQDITTHVDFTAIVEAGYDAGLTLIGYANQGDFLLNNGIIGLLDCLPEKTGLAYLRQAQGVQKLILPTEMGELFKVMALGKGIGENLMGFSCGDKSVRL